MTSTQPGQPTSGSTVRAAVVSPRGESRADRLVAAATAVGVVLLARFVLGLLTMIGAAIGYSVTAFPSGFAATPVGQFLGSFVLYPFPFYLVAFVVLLLVRPLETAAPLATVLRRALVAGAAGTAALAVVGIVPGVLLSQSGGTWANLVLYLTTIPLTAGVADTALLLVGAVLAWLWARREGDDPRGGRPDDDARTDEGDPSEPVAEQLASDSAPVVPEAVAPATASPALDGPAAGAVPSAPAPSSAPEPASSPARGRARSSAAAPDDWSRFAPPAERPAELSAERPVERPVRDDEGAR